MNDSNDDWNQDYDGSDSRSDYSSESAGYVHNDCGTRRNIDATKKIETEIVKWQLIWLTLTS